MHDGVISELLGLFERHASAIFGGDLSFASVAPFAGAHAQIAPNGSTVITLDLNATALDLLPASHRHIDLFLLEPNRELGAHYHKQATAHIYGIDGSGIAIVAGQSTPVGRADQAIFPAGQVHNVVTGAEHFLFASFQDYPIIQEDGSLDYYTAG